MIVAITVAFGPAIQLARSIIEYRKNRTIKPHRHIVAIGHYPINRAKNNRDIRMICESLGGLEVMDPMVNLGSAQTQNWVLDKIECDYFINVDPDSNCRSGWDFSAKYVLDHDPKCIVISCRAPLIERFVESRGYIAHEKKEGGISYQVYNEPVPFNLSMWRTEFIKKIGGVPQLGELWGETEGPLHALARNQGKYHAYLTHHMEDESGKFMQDRSLLEFKDANMRTPPPNRFPGRYEEFLRWKYPQLAHLNTYISEDTVWQ